MSSWPEETLIAIAEDRFMGLEKDLSIPVRNVSKACAIIHLQMTQEPTRRYRQIFSRRFLMLSIFCPANFSPSHMSTLPRVTSP